MQKVVNVAAGSLDPGPYTLAPYNGSCYEAEILVEDGDVRLETDGTNPTASTGFLLEDGNVCTHRQCNGNKFTNMKLIKASGTPTLSIIWSYK